MTVQNMERLARKGYLGHHLGFNGFCLAAAIDACFEVRCVPRSVYGANFAAVAAGEMGNEGVLTQEFYEALGRTVFGCADPQDFAPDPYGFSDREELVRDLAELRGRATVVLDTNDGQHSVGLKPHDGDGDLWTIVGTHQLVAIAVQGKKQLIVQGVVDPQPVTPAQVWSYLIEQNPQTQGALSALVFPPEPKD